MGICYIYKSRMLSLSFFHLPLSTTCSEFYRQKPLADKVLDYRLDSQTSSYFSADIADAIHQLWKDPIISKIMDERLSEFYLMDSAQ